MKREEVGKGGGVLSVSLERQGDVEVAAGNLQAARLLFARCSDILEGLAKAESAATGPS